MKDIDFDELDRAVSSLMGTVPKDEPAKDTKDDSDVPVSTTESIVSEPPDESSVIVSSSTDENSSLLVDTEPVIVPAPETTLTEEISEPEQPAPRLAPVNTPPASRGRFMDVVRPSREMRKTSSLISRQGVTLQPSAPGASIDQSSPEPSEQASVKTDTNFTAQAAVPQDMEDTASVAASTQPVFDASPITQATPFEESDDNAPLSSPFLPDAKVEKRPLGRPAESAPAIDLTSELADDMNQATEEPPVRIEEPVVSQDKDAQRPEVPLPAELDSQLLSIETGTVATDTTPVQTEFPGVTQAPISAFEAPSVEAPAVAAPTPAEPPSFAVDTQRTMAAASIPQQYKLEAAPTEEMPASAIYDTQPLAHPAKSKPGWLWILAIVAILVVGALGGAAVYYLNLL